MGLPVQFDDATQRKALQDASDAHSLGQLPPPPRTGPIDATPDVHLMRELVGFPLRSVRRHKTLAAIVFASTLLTILFVAFLMPRSYHVETRMTAQRTELMTALGNPRRSVPNDADSPTRLAAEAVRNRVNILGLVQQTRLVEQWDIIRAPIRLLADRIITQWFKRPALTPAEKADQFVEVLLKSLKVDVGTGAEDGVVTIGIDWFDRESAVRIVEQAQTNFLEQRRTSEVGRIAESVAILQEHVDSTLAVIKALIKDSSMTVAARPKSLRVATAYSTARANESPLALERQGSAAAIEAKQQTIIELETARARRLADLQGQLNSLRSRYGPAHPEVQAVEAQLAAISVDSPQLAALRADLAVLDRQIFALGGAARVAPTRADFTIPEPTTQPIFNPALAYSESRLRLAIVDYEDMTDRLKSAKIEMETANAAFKYRYIVSIPAKFPKGPEKPNLKLLAFGGVFATLGLACFAAMGADLLSGRLLEAWQVELLLGTPLLAHLDRS